jgi:hypothetical protein
MNKSSRVTFSEHELYDKNCESTAQLAAFMGAAYAALTNLGNFGNLLGGFSKGGTPKKPGVVAGGPRGPNGPPAHGDSKGGRGDRNRDKQKEKKGWNRIKM